MSTPFSPYHRRSIIWEDITHHQRVANLTVGTVTGAPATMGAIQAASNADWLTYWEGPVIPVAGVLPALLEDYSTCGYVLALSLKTDAGDTHRIFLPAPTTLDVAPRSTVLKNDRQTLDLGLAATTSLAATLAGELNHPLTTAPITSIEAGWVSRWTIALAERLEVLAGTVLLRRSVIFTDVAGRSFTTFLTSRAGSPSSQDALANRSNAIVQEYWESTAIINDAPLFHGDNYASVSDEARLYFCDDTGSRTSIVIPAPKRSIFRNDGKTVNTDDFDALEVVAAGLAELVVPSTGNPVTRYLGGYLHHNRRTSL